MLSRVRSRRRSRPDRGARTTGATRTAGAKSCKGSSRGSQPRTRAGAPSAVPVLANLPHCGAGTEGERQRGACGRNAQARMSRPADDRERAPPATGAAGVRRALQPRATAPGARTVGSGRPAATVTAPERGPSRGSADPGRAASRVRASRRVTFGRTAFSGSTGGGAGRLLRFEPARRSVSDESFPGVLETGRAGIGDQLAHHKHVSRRPHDV